FVAGARVRGGVGVVGAGRAAAAEQWAARWWRPVPAVLEQAAVPPAMELSGRSWVRARWTAPDGRARAGEISVNGALPAGRTVLLWGDAAGFPAGPPPRRPGALRP